MAFNAALRKKIKKPHGATKASRARSFDDELISMPSLPHEYSFWDGDSKPKESLLKRASRLVKFR